MDEEILNTMSFYDQTYEIPEEEESLVYSTEYERPSTADKDEDSEVNRRVVHDQLTTKYDYFTCNLRLI